MSFTEEIDRFLEKHCVDNILDAEEARSVCMKASDVLEVDVGLMSCCGEKWAVINDDKWWPNFSEIRLYLGSKYHDSTLYTFFNGHPRNRVIKVELVKLLEMIDDDDFYHNIFAFDAGFENALFDDHSGLFCGLGYFSDAMRKYC